MKEVPKAFLCKMVRMLSDPFDGFGGEGFPLSHDSLMVEE